MNKENRQIVEAFRNADMVKLKAECWKLDTDTVLSSADSKFRHDIAIAVQDFLGRMEKGGGLA